MRKVDLLQWADALGVAVDDVPQTLRPLVRGCRELLDDTSRMRGRIHKVLKWSDNRDVDDPYLQPKQAFEKSFEDIELGLEDWLKRLE